KVEAVRDWPQPTTVKELQRFLKSANFYRRFIFQYSQLSAPLTSMLKRKPKNLTWTSDALKAFRQLQSSTLTYPDPTLRFVVDADASTLGVGAQNYDVGNRKLLAIKLALEEWQHWLEGAQHQFRFKVTYCPVHKNLKADALSRLHQRNPTQEEPEPILTPTIFVCTIQWDLDDQIRAATLPEPAPPGGPEGKDYVPTSLRLILLDSVHTSPGLGHPGSQQTLSLLRNQMSPVTSKAARWYPYPCLANPLSHLGVDFAADLPASQGYTTILVIVDRFSKAGKLISLKGLPTALETVKALFHYVFHHFGIPEDIVSDRGPQFISRVWRGFFRLLGVSVSLSSGYHPQTNCQTECKIQEIGRYLLAYYHEHQDSWIQFLPWAEYAQNSLRQETTGLTPFQCILGYQPPLFPWTGELTKVPAVDYWFHESERVWDSAHIHLQRAIRRHKENADARCSPIPLYHPGGRVWLSTQDIRIRLPSKKLIPR
ncbi:hypothetical protein M9458_023125, partial [Cirrhinus mrigala]